MDCVFKCDKCFFATIVEWVLDEHQLHSHGPPQGPNAIHEILPSLHKPTEASTSSIGKYEMVEIISLLLLHQTFL